MVRTDDIPVARIADREVGDTGNRLYRGRVWVGSTVVCEAIQERTTGWEAGEDADWLCVSVRETDTSLSFRQQVRCVLVAAASLPMACLGILESMTDEDLEMHRIAQGDATDVACFIANISVGEQGAA